VLLSDGGSGAGADVAARIGHALEEPFHLGDTSISIEASIGITEAAATGEGPTLEELLRQAQETYPDRAARGAWWEPAHRGGGAPTPEHITSETTMNAHADTALQVLARG